MEEQESTRCRKGAGSLPVMEFGDIDTSGAYVIHGVGVLVRVPSDDALAGRSPALTISGDHTVVVSRISTDPWITANKARGIAANNDLPVRF